MDTEKLKKYIITLKPIITKRKNSENPQLTKNRKAIITAQDECKRKCNLDKQMSVKIAKLEKIGEKSVISSSSLEATKINLKASQGTTNISRLSGGLVVHRTTKWKKHNSGEEKFNVTKESRIIENLPKVKVEEESNGQYSSTTIQQSEHEKENIIEKNEVEGLADNALEEGVANKQQDSLSLDNKYDILLPAVVFGDNKDSNNENSKITNEHQITSTFEHELKSLSQSKIITSSFIENILEETRPIARKDISKFEFNDLMPAYGETPSIHNACDPLDVSPIDSKIVPDIVCERLDQLESQVELFYSELENLQKSMVPSVDLAKLNVLLKHFNEVNNLLVEVKLNCLKFQNIQNQINQRSDPRLDMKLTLQQNFQSSTNFSRSQIYFGACNCEIHETPQPLFIESSSNVCDSLKACSKKEIPAAQLYDGSKHTENPPNIPEQQSRQQEKQDDNLTTSFENVPSNSYKKVSPIISQFRQAKDRNIRHKVLLRQEEYQKGNINLESGYNQRKKNSQTKHFQRFFSGSKQSFISDLSKTTFKTCNTATNKQSSKKKRSSAGRDNLFNSTLSLDKSTNTESLLSESSLIWDTQVELPLTTRHLIKAIWQIVGNTKSNNVALTIFLQSDDLYHINISVVETGQCLGCIYTNEPAFKEAKENKLFENFLVFFVLNPENNLEERNQILEYSFEFLKNNDSNLMAV